MTDINSLSTEWQSLRNSDNQMEKVRVLKNLGNLLGHEGAPAQQVLAHLGQPDDVKPSLNGGSILPTMPGPVISSELGQNNNNNNKGSGDQALYFIYYTQSDRKGENYLYFKVNENETIATSGWK
ncbi:hypothetical protein BJ944DRAFT_250251 [Cunninghamella echinulata]|nr:hypothetical protein BJ944DRAFT_250251 [Cunninghamella echinulata]